jgi:single-stranded-DNA-specific exonuclease
MHRRWLVNRTNPEYIKYLSKFSSISPVLAQIFINRGIKTPEEISSFLNPNISQLSDPFDIQGMKIAVERIMAALKKGEKVLVHGDYDVDGLSATAIILRVLKMLGIDSHYFIPNRMKHGYGFNLSSVKIAKQLGATLIITVDCGITSFETVAWCKKEGIDVIITDHHEPLRQSIEHRIQNTAPPPLPSHSKGEGKGGGESLDTAFFLKSLILNLRYPIFPELV